jgi:hypothetical protein
MLIGMATSSSRGSSGKALTVDGEADWRRNYCFLPPQYEWHKCTCHHLRTIDVWEWDDSNRARMRYFKCADTDPNFIVWW